MYIFTYGCQSLFVSIFTANRLGGQTTSTNPFYQELLRDESDSSLDLETMHLMLEPNMRPVTPDPSSRISLEIFNEHKQLAQEFLKVRISAPLRVFTSTILMLCQVQTEIAYVTQHREELLSKMDPETRRQKLEVCSKLEERDSLLKLEANLRKQLELIDQSKVQQQQQQQQGPIFNPSIQHNRLQGSSGGGGTLTNLANTIRSPTSEEVQDNWVFIDPAKPTT